jgi:alkylation response protein AidB-like acyl-CoA dehydrogenase
MMDDERGYSPELWKKMADLGWQGLVIPEAYTGVGSSFLDLVVLLEEMGRALVPGPFVPTVVYGARPIAAHGTEEQQRKFLPGIAAGEVILALAHTEANGGLEASDITARAVKSGSGFLINGRKLFVQDAHVADHLLCVVRTSDASPESEGITLFMVDARSKGVSVKLLKSLSGEKLCEVSLDGVRVPGEAVLGEVDRGWPIMARLLEEAEVAECAWMTGGARWVLDTSVQYACQRIQFGVPIGSFQAIQHKCANMAVEVEGATSATYYAAWAVSENDAQLSVAASVAKAWCSDTYKHAAVEGIQIHGGIGYTWDHDMHLYLKRAKSSEVAFGDADYHRERVARLAKLE